MLEELSIRNYALIDNLTLPFERGLTILTGETGAGKSIVVGALSFLLGAKTDIEVIRTGAEEAQVQAVLSPEYHEALDWLASRGMELENGQVFVRRSIKATGRGAVYIQNVPVSRTDLEEFMGLLFDLHGQHAHESLLKKESHRRYLDRFARLEEEVADYNAIFLVLVEKRKALEASVSSGRDRELRLEMLRFALEEIDKAALKSGESRDLETEAARLGDYEKLAELAGTTAEALSEGEASTLSLGRRARTALEGAAAIDASLESLRKRMEDLYYEAEDISGELRFYREGLRSDPGRLEEVEERLALIQRLRKKYAQGNSTVTVEDAILAYREGVAVELEALSGAEENREHLAAEIATLERDLGSQALSLSSKRAAGAVSLGQEISGIIAVLGMPKARFSVQSVPRRRENGGGLVCGPWGADEVEFLISANPGEPLKDLSRIASGGELSRVMLAIKTVLSASGAGSAETLIFDEIDTGIGGEVALSVGEYLARIAGGDQGRQIFCVTHLASIAVRADHHLKVEKRVCAVGGGPGPGGIRTGGERTLTSVSALSGEGRRQEIARMLAGDAVGTAALAHAGELLVKYGSGS
ncbi:MAG: DNA repair protein RecN [Treponema sp.]|jgi:DNA repair protein RecN (Recombination protein N)|nr:DNA repair protein RecN [Treponema sp.]